MTKCAVFTVAVCTLFMSLAPVLAEGASDAFVAACVAAITSKGGPPEVAQKYCSCAEAQRHGALDDRDQRTMSEAMLGKKDAFRVAYPELSKEQLAARLDALDAIMARLAKKTDELCGQPGKAPSSK
jgi:hypothetical protein